ncbi:MAG: hypothetical protein JJU42_04425 [Rhodobacteraceae bacterium]|nr:hypothetical protein [Paracoccaceae bacterium]
MSLRSLFRPLALAAALLSAPMASAAMTQSEINEALRGNSDIYNALFTAAIIHHVAETCDTLGGPNRLERVAFFLPIYRQARSMGFSRRQIEAFVDDKAEQERMRALVHRHLERAGVAPTDGAAVCAWGRQQIEERTPIGRRLSER